MTDENKDNPICIHCKAVMVQHEQAKRGRQVLTWLAMLIPIFTFFWAFGYLSDRKPPVLTTTGMMQTILLAVIAIGILILVLRGLRKKDLQVCPGCGYHYERVLGHDPLQ